MRVSKEQNIFQKSKSDCFVMLYQCCSNAARYAVPVPTVRTLESRLNATSDLLRLLPILCFSSSPLPAVTCPSRVCPLPAPCLPLARSMSAPCPPASPRVASLTLLGARFASFVLLSAAQEYVVVFRELKSYFLEGLPYLQLPTPSGACLLAAYSSLPLARSR
jgi:hypothetical protein